MAMAWLLNSISVRGEEGQKEARPIALVILLSLFALGPRCLGVYEQRTAVMLPLNCSELLPDSRPFTDFFEAVAVGVVREDPPFARRLFEILSIRSKLFESARRFKEENPVDLLIQKTLCFYREKKDPLKPVTYDDKDFRLYLKRVSVELQQKVNDAVYQWEMERYQRSQYEMQLEKNRKVIDGMRDEADRAADHTLQKLSKKAEKDVISH